MSPKTISLLAVLVVCVYPATASTYYVGPCKSNSYSTISAAVTAVPPGSTIMICPGTYIEQQIIISKDLTLKGMDGSAADGGDGAQIYAYSPPQTTSSVVFTYLLYELRGAITPIIWVTGGTVNIQNISVYSEADQGPFCPGPTTVGFFTPAVRPERSTMWAISASAMIVKLESWQRMALLLRRRLRSRTAFQPRESLPAARILLGMQPLG